MGVSWFLVGDMPGAVNVNRSTFDVEQSSLPRPGSRRVVARVSGRGGCTRGPAGIGSPAKSTKPSRSRPPVTGSLTSNSWAKQRSKGTVARTVARVELGEAVVRLEPTLQSHRRTAVVGWLGPGTLLYLDLSSIQYAGPLRDPMMKLQLF